MFRDITLGQYYRQESPIHGLDPRVKLMGTLIYIISLFICENLGAYLAAAAFLALVIAVSKVPLSYMLRGMRSIWLLLLLTVVFNIFLTPGEAVFRWGPVSITWEGVELAGVMALRLTMLIMGSSMMTLTTTPNHLTEGMEKWMSPLKWFRVPVHEVAMMMAIALRFIPILLEETDKIMKAQMARGADFESGGLIKKARALLPLLVPLFISAFRRANDLAMAMEARCYKGGEGRGKMKPLAYGPGDWVGYVSLALYLALIIGLNRFWPWG